MSTEVIKPNKVEGIALNLLGEKLGQVQQMYEALTKQAQELITEIVVSHGGDASRQWQVHPDGTIRAGGVNAGQQPVGSDLLKEPADNS